MPFSPAEWVKGRLLPVALILVAGLVIFEAGRRSLAEFYDQSSTPSDWERAAALEPGNADYWQHLGRYRQWDFQNTDLRRAVEYYQRATQLDPQSPFYWLDLASAHEMAGNSALARQAFEKAKSTYPISAGVAWNYGNFLLRSGDLPDALVEIQHAIAVDPRLAPQAVSVCWRAGVDFDRIFNQIVPPHAPAYLSAVEFFLGEGDADSALKVWDRLRGLNEPVQLKQSFPLIDQLIRLDRFSDARSVWEQSLALAHREAATVAPGSLIWDGGFEQGFLNGGFGWYEIKVAGASFLLDSSSPHSGDHALQVSFDGSANLNFGNILQYVVVQPRTRYRFQAYVRCNAISTDRGVHFRIFDLRHPAALNVETEDLTGTLSAWTPQGLEFVTGPETRFLVVALSRRPSTKLDNKLSGTVWVDDVSLIPVETGPPSKP